MPNSLALSSFVNASKVSQDLPHTTNINNADPQGTCNPSSTETCEKALLPVGTINTSSQVLENHDTNVQTF